MILLLLCGVAMGQTTIQVKSFACPNPKVSGIKNEGKMSGLRLVTQPGICVLWTTTRVNDVTIDGEHFDWCDPTKGGATLCHKKLLS